MILAIDFDRVIHDVDNPVPGRRMGSPVAGAARYITELRRAGHTIIVHTTRANPPHRTLHVRDWLLYYGIPFDDITAVKPSADLYIDDKAVRFTNWPDTFAEVTRSA